MAIALMSRDDIVTKARRILGVTDATKGGPDNTVFQSELSRAMARFAVRAGALKTVIKLATKANDKYLPLVDEILWPITVSFVDTAGLSYVMDQVESAPRPGSVGALPRYWWLTAVNVPDATGPSVRTIGIDPYVNYAPTPGTYNVLLEAIQLPQDLASGVATPELHVSVHPYISYFLAAEMLGLYPEKAGMADWIEARCAEGVDVFQTLTRAQKHAPHTSKDAMGYARRMYPRI